MQTTWTEDLVTKKKEYPAFSGTTKADAVIIGGGITGIVSAYLLAKAGKKVVVLEKGTIGSGITSLTTAFLTQSIDTDFTDLISSFGKKTAKEVIASHQEAIDLARKITGKEKIDCDFQTCSNYIYANSEKEYSDLEEELKAAKELGVNARMQADGSELGFKNCGFIEIKNQAKFHPLKYMLALAEKAKTYGALIYEHSEVKKIEQLDNGKQKIITGRGSIEAQYCLVATYNPFDNPLKLYFRKGTYVSYIIELAVEGMMLKEGTYEDTENPYHYMRVDARKSGYRIVIGGEDHRKDVPVNKTKNFNALIKYSDSIIPKQYRTIRKKWAGDILEPIDGLPSIGQIDNRKVFYTLGFSGNGMTYAHIASRMFADYVNHKQNPRFKIYDPTRVPTAKSLIIKGRDYAEELLRGAVKNAITQHKKPKSQFGSKRR